MFNYHDTKLVQKMDVFTQGVPYPLRVLLETCGNICNKLIDASIDSVPVPPHIVLEDLTSIVFYLKKYIDSAGIDSDECYHAFEYGVLKNIASTGGGVNVNTLWDKPMMIANQHGSTYTLEKTLEVLEQDVLEKAQKRQNGE